MRTEEVFFTVIIPTYNRKQLLGRAIDSVLCQTYKNFELIVVDDGSDDGSKDLVSENYPNIKYMYQSNKGVSSARNIAAANALGEYLAFLDSDDEWLPQKLQRQYDFLLEFPDTKILHCDEIWVRNGKRVNQMKKHRKQGGEFFARALDLCLISPSAVVIEKKFFDAHNGFNEDYTVCEDYDLWLRMKADNRIGDIGYLEEPLLVKYGGHEDQLSHKYFAMDLWRVKSIASLLTQSKLSSKQAHPAFEVFKDKTNILLNGYKKHQNIEMVQQINDLIHSVQSYYKGNFQ